jgi:hypothetical protein
VRLQPVRARAPPSLEYPLRKVEDLRVRKTLVMICRKEPSVYKMEGTGSRLSSNWEFEIVRFEKPMKMFFEIFPAWFLMKKHLLIDIR